MADAADSATTNATTRRIGWVFDAGSAATATDLGAASGESTTFDEWFRRANGVADAVMIRSRLLVKRADDLKS